MLLFIFAAISVGIAGVCSQPSITPSITISPKPSAEPCSIVSSDAASYMSANPSGKSFIVGIQLDSNSNKATAAVLKPSEVYACLRSIPYDRQKDTEQIAWIKYLLQFQSTLAYLKNPPSSYPLPAVDLIGGLDRISSAITDGKYSDEYSIEVCLQFYG